MIQIKLKHFIVNFLSISFAIFLCFLLTNFIFIKISHQKLFPRSLAGSLPNILFTFYGDTYSKKSLKKYTAILGGSYAQGGGDAYLNRVYDYSIAHHLNKIDKKNYLNFARAGFGSISATSNLINIYNLSNFSNSIEDLEKPNSIIFFFNEDYLLEANINEYRLFGKQNQDISDFVINRINDKLQFSSTEKIANNFPLILFISKIGSHIKDFFSAVIENPKKTKSLLTDRLKKLFGHTIILKSNLDSKKNLDKNINSIKNYSKVKNIPPLSGASLNLTKDEISLALEIFKDSIKFLKSWSKIDNISIVYIPSPITSYTWNEPINYQISGTIEVRHVTNEKNKINNIFIRKIIKEFSENNEIQFLDLTDHIIKISENKILHGPLDWLHLNYDGYKSAASYIIENDKKN